MKVNLKKILEKKGTIVCRLPGRRLKWGLFHSPCEIKTAFRKDEVPEALEWLKRNLKDGKYAAGFISYDAAPAFDSANAVRKPSVFSGKLRRGKSVFPLLWFASYKSFCDVPLFLPDGGSFSLNLAPEMERSNYLERVKIIKKFIFDGDIYQANFTFRTIGKRLQNSGNVFLRLFHSHPVPYAAYVNAGDFQIISNSPELFLSCESGILHSMPMKGTAQRGMTPEDDAAVAKKLSADPKNRAENVMIVDMMRNDFGRVCEAGSIFVKPLFHVDAYPTVHQMISGVYGKVRENMDVAEILAATFPPASVTGAPKIRATEIIAELEASQRKIYTGAIGCFMPSGDFCLNVAIRTILCLKDRTELGVGGGIVADSNPEEEWRECILKSSFASFKLPTFDVLETILWERGRGFIFLEEHLRRARNSQKYFGRKWNKKNALGALRGLEIPKTAYFARVRLRISQNGSVNAEFAVLAGKGWGRKNLRIKLSGLRTDSKNIFLYHKTTNRKFYDFQFKKACGRGFDEIIFMNEKNEITEGAISNIFVRKGGRWLTPPVDSGLLPGIWREKMIRKLKAEEKVLYTCDLRQADEIIVGNSVRGEGKVLSLQTTGGTSVLHFL